MAGTKRSKIKKNDQVAIIAGRDKGRRGRVLEVLPAKGKDQSRRRGNDQAPPEGESAGESRRRYCG